MASGANVGRARLLRSRGRWLGRIRILGGQAFAVALPALASPTRASVAWSIPLLLGGLAIRAWAAGHLVKRKRLTTSGPYGHLRHPLYLGSVLLLAGACAAARSRALWAASTIALVVTYVPVVRQEELHDEQELAAEPAAYRRNVPMLIPSLRSRTACTTRWELRRYLDNGEYTAALGVAVALAYLVLRLS